MGMKDPKERVPYVLDMIYPHTYLDSVNPEDPSGGTFRELQTKACFNPSTSKAFGSRPY
jgi:hypothetical protein